MQSVNTSKLRHDEKVAMSLNCLWKSDAPAKQIEHLLSVSQLILVIFSLHFHIFFNVLLLWLLLETTNIGMGCFCPQQDPDSPIRFKLAQWFPCENGNACLLQTSGNAAIIARTRWKSRNGNFLRCPEHSDVSSHLIIIQATVCTDRTNFNSFSFHNCVLYVGS